MSSGELGPITRLFLRALQRVGSRWWAFRASRPPSPQARCSCDPAIFPNPGITVLNYKRQPVPGAQVYVDGKYVGTTSAEPGKVGRIWPAEFTPCASHLVTVIACDGSRATKTLGYWCYPSQGAATGQGAFKMLGQESVDNVIYVFTDKCGATGEVAAGPLPPSYSITFKESGLPEGASWCVDIGGVTPCATNYGGDSGNIITFANVAPGTYNYRISTQSSYVPNPTSGSVTVSESNPNPVVYVAFSPASGASGGGGATGQSASTNPPQECHCSPDQYQSIIVINNQRQLIPGAQVYIDGQYVGTTGSDVTDMGMISNGFTPCQWHDVTVVACDGTTASARLGYFCYPGNMYVYNVIVVPTGNCGGSMSWAGPI